MKRKRMEIKIKTINLSLLLVLFTFVVLFIKPTEVSAAKVKAPETIKLTTFELGSSAYMAYGFIGEYMIKKYGTKLRVIPIGSDVGRMTALRLGIVQFVGEGPGAPFAIEATSPRYSTHEWGPQHNMRVVWMGQHAGQALVVRGSSKIYSISDLKGKRVGIIPGSYFEQLAPAHLAYAGLTLNDVKRANCPSYSACARRVIDGSIDTMVAMVTSPIMRELEASPYGIRWLPESDPVSFERIRKKVSFYVPARVTIGAGLSESNPLDCSTFPYPMTICYENIDEDVAYFMTKVINEGYDTYAVASTYMKHYWRLDSFLNLYESVNFAILHRGTVKYLKEIGRWKPAYEKFQKNRVEYLKRLDDLWKKVGDEAFENKIKAKDFPKFWLKKRAEVFGQ